MKNNTIPQVKYNVLEEQDVNTRQSIQNTKKKNRKCWA